MKINAVGINSYRQAMEKPQVEKQPAPENRTQVKKSDAVSIADRADRVGSKLAVRLEPGTFVDMLSTEEKQAFEKVFEKYGRPGMLTGTYAKSGENQTANTGTHVDVKL